MTTADATAFLACWAPLLDGPVLGTAGALVELATADGDGDSLLVELVDCNSVRIAWRRVDVTVRPRAPATYWPVAAQVLRVCARGTDSEAPSGIRGHAAMTVASDTPVVGRGGGQ